MDPLSDILSLLRLRSYNARTFSVGGAWSLAFPASSGLKLYALASGQGWLRVDGMPEPIPVCAGDCLLLPRGLPFVVSSDPALPSVDAEAVLPSEREAGPFRYGGGGDVFGITGSFALSEGHAWLLRDILPPVVRVAAETDKATLRWCLDRMAGELTAPQPGSALACQHLATMMLLQVLRAHLSSSCLQSKTWIAGLANSQLRPAIASIHDDPARRWTVESLARAAGMSRTSFAVRFREIVGVSPIEYLTRWRMALAGNRLQETEASISVIASALGYESESAFGTAFKRTIGCSPRQYRRAARSCPGCGVADRWSSADFR